MRRAESPVTVVRIISTEQFQEMMLREKGAESIAAKYEEAERYLEKLAQSIDELQKAADAAAAKPDSSEAAEELQKKIDAAQKAAAQAAKNLQKLSEQPMPIDVDRELAKRLARMAEDAAKTAKTLGEMKKSQGGKGGLTSEQKEQLRKMAEQTSGQRTQLDKQAIQPLERLQQAMPLLIDEQRFAELAAQQRDLAQRLESLRSSPDPHDAKVERRIAELEAEQQQLRESLENLLDDIAANADALPDVPDLQKLKSTAKNFSEAVRRKRGGSEMSGTQEKLLGSNFPGAIDDARKAADIMESFLGKCHGMGNGACESCKLAFNPSAGCPNLGDSLQQMLAMLGMKPGTGYGGNPAAGFGFGAGGGYSVRSPGPHNVGMYGSLPMTSARSSQGRGNRQSQGVATNSAASPQQSGMGDGAATAQGNAAGQAESSVPRAISQPGDEVLPKGGRAIGRETMKSRRILAAARTHAPLACCLLAIIAARSICGADVSTSKKADAAATVPDPASVGGEPASIVQVANLIYAGTKTSECFADHFLRRGARFVDQHEPATPFGQTQLR